MSAARTLTHSGAFDLEVASDRITAACAAWDDPDPSPYGAALTRPSRTRVVSAAVRRSWLDEGPGARPHLRGREPLVEVPLDRALDLLAGELLRVRDTCGPQAIFAGSYGWASPGRFHHAQSQLKRFLTQFGGFTAAEGTYSHGAAERVVPRVLGRSFRRMLREHRPVTEIAEHTELLVSFGGFPAANRRIVNGGTARHVLREGLLAARDRGCRFIAIGPVRTGLDEELGARWLPIRPGSDTAVLLAVLHVLVTESLVDLEAARRVSSGLDRLIDEVLGRSDGVPCTPGWAAELSGIEPDDITHLARRMAASRTLVNATWSIQRTEHGEQALWSLIAVATVLGQLRLPGAGLGIGYGSMGSVGAPVCRPEAPALPAGGANPVQGHVPVARLADLLLEPGGRYWVDGEERTYPRIELVYWAGGNPFHHHQDLHRLERAWRQPATVVVHEPSWTATAQRADIVLPATTPLERRDVGGGSVDAALVAMEPVVTPPGAACDDHELLRRLAARLGFERRFTAGRDVDAWLSWLYERFRAQDPRLPDEATFWREGIARRHPDHQVRADWEAFLAGPEAAPLPTVSGRIVLSEPAHARQGLPVTPRWTAPTEWLGGAGPDQLHLLSPQPPHQLHSQHDEIDTEGRRDERGREPVWMHPSDAAARGISDGDDVRLHNRRGRCLATARLTPAIRPGVVSLATGAWWDPGPDVDGVAVCRRGNPNALTRDIATSTWAQATSAHTCLVEVERVVDAPLPAPHAAPQLRR